MCVGSRRQVRIEWDGSSLVRWNHDPARVEAVLRLSGHTPEGLFLAHVMMRSVSMRGPTTPPRQHDHADADSTGAMCVCPLSA